MDIKIGFSSLGKQIVEGIWEQDALENIWTNERGYVMGGFDSL
jgi:hypothetical protein